MNKGASISTCKKYRRSLYRSWGVGKKVCFIMLNPSTADGMEDDPTIRRCINFAKLWGYDGIVVKNLFAYRATSPNDMKIASDPIGPENMNDLQNITRSVDIGMVVCAWGTHGGYMGQDKVVIKMLSDFGVKLNAIKITKSGHPSHPLYLKNDLIPFSFPKPKAADLNMEGI